MSSFPTPEHDDARVRLARAILAISRELELRHDADPDIVTLTPTERIVMRVIDQHPGVTPSEIADRVGMRRPNVSAAVRGLREKGLAERRPGAADRRETPLVATDRAHANLVQLEGVWRQAIDHAWPAGAEPGGAADALERAAEALAEARIVHGRDARA
ncbi:MarR family transcriptional regulator [Microbacterium excoecariae]|uniref:MarR family transcriptional regulator n=1 Tax=Microbacterium excoecariae TaxID=2715210 RepID=UPI0014096D4B